MAKIGRSPRVRMPCKAAGIGNQTVASKAFGRIHSVELTEITKASTMTSSHNQRLHDHVIVKGFQIVKRFENTWTSNKQISVNVAVVTSKVHSSEITLTDGDPEWDVEFFRDWENYTRVKDFDQGTTSRSGLANYVMPINSDRWIVHKRWRKILEPANSPDDYKKTWIIKKWVPFNRQLIFDDDNDHPDTGRTFVIYWFDQPDRSETTDIATGAVTAATHSGFETVFFRDAKLC